MTVGEALRQGAGALGRAGIEGGARDARVLMAAALGCGVDRLVLREGETIGAGAAAAFEAMVAERVRRRPVAQIVGRRLFWGLEIGVTADVLDPRPETETLVAAALAGGPARRVLDLGTGSGAILLALLADWPEAEGVGVDISPAAVAVARGNAERLGLAARCRLVVGDWDEGVAGRFDLVVSNPPYIPAGEVEGLAPEVRDWEPRGALTAGPTGLEAYRRIAAALPRLLVPGGRVLVEIGAGQAEAVGAILGAAGLGAIRGHPDLDGRIRVLEGRGGGE